MTAPRTYGDFLEDIRAAARKAQAFADSPGHGAGTIRSSGNSTRRAHSGGGRFGKKLTRHQHARADVVAPASSLGAGRRTPQGLWAGVFLELLQRDRARDQDGDFDFIGRFHGVAPKSVSSSAVARILRSRRERRSSRHGRLPGRGEANVGHKEGKVESRIIQLPSLFFLEEDRSPSGMRMS